MIRFRNLAAAGLVAATLSLSSSAQAQTAYAANNFGTTLIRFDVSSPGTFTTIGNFSGATSSIDGLDFRPSNGLLYGYDSGGNRVVSINTFNAVTTFVSNPTTAATTNNLGVDFNPVPDRLRLVNTDAQNLRINVATGATIKDGDLAYATGDVNEGDIPAVNEVAYTNSDKDPATGTKLYYIDFVNDALLTTTNPNGGVLMTVGSLGVDTDDFTGFDIYTANGGNSAFALLRVNGVSGLYNLNLGTGAASFLGELGGGFGVDNAYGLAVAPVPEPGAVAFAVIAGLSLCGLTLRRRATR